MIIRSALPSIFLAAAFSGAVLSGISVRIEGNTGLGKEHLRRWITEDPLGDKIAHETEDTGHNELSQQVVKIQFVDQ